MFRSSIGFTRLIVRFPRVRGDVPFLIPSFPRVRGDVPVADIFGMRLQEFSPRARGCSDPPLYRPVGCWVFPACAGMFLADAASNNTCL